MGKFNENLSKILDVEPIEFDIDGGDIVEEEQSGTDIVPVENGNDVNVDTEFARKNIKDLIDVGNEAVDKLIKVAEESESPRAYEVLSTMMKNIADMNKDLLELQKRKRELGPRESGSKQQNINVDKAVVFTGSTTELIKLIRSQKE